MLAQSSHRVTQQRSRVQQGWQPAGQMHPTCLPPGKSPFTVCLTLGKLLTSSGVHTCINDKQPKAVPV